MSEPLTTRLTIHHTRDSERIMWSLLTYSGHKPNHVRMTLQEHGVCDVLEPDPTGLSAVALLLARAVQRGA